MKKVIFSFASETGMGASIAEGNGLKYCNKLILQQIMALWNFEMKAKPLNPT